MQGWSDFAVFGDRQACKTLVLGEIVNLWLNTSLFQRRFNMLLCSSKENIRHSFAITQTLGILLTVVARKGLGGD